MVQYIEEFKVFFGGVGLTNRKIVLYVFLDWNYSV